MTLWPRAMHTGWSRCPVQADFPVCSSPGRGCGSGGYKAAGEARRGGALDLRPSGHHARGPECGVRGGPAPALRASPQDPAAAAGLGLPPSQVLPAAGRPREGGGRLCAGTGLRPDAALTLSERRFPVKTGGLEYSSRMRIRLKFSPRLGRLGGCNAVATKRREAPRAPWSHVQEGRMGIVGVSALGSLLDF